MKKYIVIILILNFLLLSCSEVEIISDQYWYSLVSDFQGKAVGLRFQAFINGKSLKLTVADAGEGLSEIGRLTETKSNIYLFSPMLSQSILSYGESDSSCVFYYFGDINRSAAEDSSDNMVIIERDRGKAFYEAGIMTGVEVADAPIIIPVVYDVDNSVQKEEVMSFLDGIKNSGRNLAILSLEVDSDTSESEIRNFFDRENVKNSSFLAVFTNKWKTVCYELSERDGKLIVTSDSWFYKNYESFIVFSVEDDVKGMMKKVYNNIKTGKHADITLDGCICR